MSDLISTLVIARENRLRRFKDCVAYFLEHQRSWSSYLNPFSSTLGCPNLFHVPKDLETGFETTWMIIRPSEWTSQIVYDSSDVNQSTAAVALFFNDIMKCTMSAYKIHNDHFPKTYPLYIDYGIRLDWIIRKKSIFAAVPLDKNGMPQTFIYMYYMGATNRGLLEWCPDKHTIKAIPKRPLAVDLYILPWFTSNVLTDYEALFTHNKLDDSIGYCIPPNAQETLVAYKVSYLEKMLRDVRNYNKQYTVQEKEKEKVISE